MCLPAFLFNFPVDCFLEFSCQTHVGLVFWLNCLFWACFSNLLGLFLQINLASLLVA